MRWPVAVSGSVAFGALATMLTIAELREQPACIDPRDHGAEPDDGEDDRLGLQAAFDEAQLGCVDLRGGVWDVSRNPGDGPKSIPSLVLRAQTQLRGSGAAIAMLGTGRRASGQVGDWVLLQVQDADGASVIDLRLDGAARTDTGEQTHLLQVRGPAKNVRIENVRMHLPMLGRHTGGDCLRLFGEHDAWVQGVSVRNVHAGECERSFVAVQRGVSDVVIEGVSVERVMDQAIDFEPTGAEAFRCTPIARNITVRNARLAGAAEAGVDAAATIAGRDCAVADNIVFEDVELQGGGLDVLDVGRVTLTRVSLTPGATSPPLHVRGRVGSLRIVDSTLSRGFDSRGPLIEVKRFRGVSPTEVVVVGGELMQGANAPAVRLEHAPSLVMVGTRIVLGGTSGWAVVSEGAGSVALVDVALQGPWSGLARGTEPAWVKGTR